MLSPVTRAGGRDRQHGRERGGANVFALEDAFGIAAAGDVQHGLTDLFGGQDMIGKGRTEKRQQVFRELVKGPIGLGFGLDCVERLNDAGPKHVGSGEEHVEDGVFGFSFYAGPHHAAVLRAVGAGSGDIDEGHLRIKAAEDIGGRGGDSVGEAFVFYFVHSAGRDPETEKAGIEAGELRFNRLVIPKIAVDDFADFWMELSGSGASDGLDELHIVREERFAQHTLADHPGCAEDHDVHRAILRLLGCRGRRKSSLFSGDEVWRDQPVTGHPYQSRVLVAANRSRT